MSIVIITGGAKGIGAAITRAFAAEGAVACVFGRNREEAAALVASYLKQKYYNHATVEIGIRTKAVGAGPRPCRRRST